MLSEKRTGYIPVGLQLALRVCTSLPCKEADADKEHCLNHLRKSAMCHGDVGMVTYRWANISRKPQAAATAHQCIDWDSLAEWTNERTINMFTPGFLVHPTKGKWAAFAISLLLL